MNDPDVRQRLQDEIDTRAVPGPGACGYPEDLIVHGTGGVERFEPLLGRRVGDLAEEWGCTVTDVLLDLSIEGAFKVEFKGDCMDIEPDDRGRDPAVALRRARHLRRRRPLPLHRAGRVPDRPARVGGPRAAAHQLRAGPLPAQPAAGPHGRLHRPGRAARGRPGRRRRLRPGHDRPGARGGTRPSAPTTGRPTAGGGRRRPTACTTRSSTARSRSRAATAPAPRRASSSSSGGADDGATARSSRSSTTSTTSSPAPRRPTTSRRCRASRRRATSTRTFFELEMEAIRRCWVIVGTVHEWPERRQLPGDRPVGHGQRAGRAGRRRRAAGLLQHLPAPWRAGHPGGVRHGGQAALPVALVAVRARRAPRRTSPAGATSATTSTSTAWRSRRSAARCGAGSCSSTSTRTRPTLVDWLGPVADQATWFDGLRTAARSELTLNCNWKICIEANIEVYHLTTVHPTTVARIARLPRLDPRAVPAGPQPDGRPVGRLRRRRHARGRGRGRRPVRRAACRTPTCRSCSSRSTSRRAGPTGMTLQTFWPLDVDRTLLEWWTMVPDWGDGDPPAWTQERNDYFDQVMARGHGQQRAGAALAAGRRLPRASSPATTSAASTTTRCRWIG